MAYMIYLYNSQNCFNNDTILNLIETQLTNRQYHKIEYVNKENSSAILHKNSELKLELT